jgi:hypothetical protein
MPPLAVDPDFNSKEILDLLEGRQLVLSTELLIHFSAQIAGDHRQKIIDVDREQESHFSSHFSSVETIVGVEANESNFDQELVQGLISNVRRLIRPVNAYLEPAHVAGRVLAKTWWLLHENFLIKIAVQEGCLDVELQNGPPTMESVHNDTSDRFETDHRRISFRVVNAHALQESTYAQAGFKPLDATSSIAFQRV